MNFEEAIGHHLMIGISGTRLTRETVKQFQKTHAAGLIVFRPNFKSAAAFKKLLFDLEKKLGRKLLVAVDHEGGRVIHLAQGVTVFPDNWALGNSGKAGYAAGQGAIEARELRRLGIDLNLAPTVDVLTEKYSPNIGIRSYGKNTNLVSRLGSARIKAMQKSGLSACAKHFPGLGASTLDPHLDLPVLGMTWAELKKVHLKPFLSAMKSGVDCMMSSHPVYPKLDASKVPATFSRKIIREFLRKKLKFKGVILSDDLEMGALRGLCTIGESAVRAVLAGHDMVLLCHDPKAQTQAYGALLKAYRSGRLNPANLKESVQRVQHLVSKRSRRFEGGIPRPEKEGAKLASEIAREGITPKRGLTPFVFMGGGTSPYELTVFFPRISDLAGKFYIEKEWLDEKKFVGELFRKNGMTPVAISRVSLNPEEKEVQSVLKRMKSKDTVIFFCYDAHASQGTRKILTALSRGKKNAAVLLRNPYDALYIEGKIPFVTAYGFRKVQLEAAVCKLSEFMKAPV